MIKIILLYCAIVFLLIFSPPFFFDSLIPKVQQHMSQINNAFLLTKLIADNNYMCQLLDLSFNQSLHQQLIKTIEDRNQTSKIDFTHNSLEKFARNKLYNYFAKLNNSYDIIMKENFSAIEIDLDQDSVHIKKEANNGYQDSINNSFIQYQYHLNIINSTTSQNRNISNSSFFFVYQNGFQPILIYFDHLAELLQIYLNQSESTISDSLIKVFLFLGALLVIMGQFFIIPIIQNAQYKDIRQKGQDDAIRIRRSQLFLHYFVHFLALFFIIQQIYLLWTYNGVFHQTTDTIYKNINISTKRYIDLRIIQLNSIRALLNDSQINITQFEYIEKNEKDIYNLKMYDLPNEFNQFKENYTDINYQDLCKYTNNKEDQNICNENKNEPWTKGLRFGIVSINQQLKDLIKDVYSNSKAFQQQYYYLKWLDFFTIQLELDKFLLPEMDDLLDLFIQNSYQYYNNQQYVATEYFKSNIIAFLIEAANWLFFVYSISKLTLVVTRQHIEMINDL